ncbi:MAG: hypothetical protein L0170_04240 [Acidobacteria bacterium]|nr:hypothetical protein [Acidobacteriota bacterium]
MSKARDMVEHGPSRKWMFTVKGAAKIRGVPQEKLLRFVSENRFLPPSIHEGPDGMLWDASEVEAFLWWRINRVLKGGEQELQGKRLRVWSPEAVKEFLQERGEARG